MGKRVVLGWLGEAGLREDRVLVVVAGCGWGSTWPELLDIVECPNGLTNDTDADLVVGPSMRLTLNQQAERVTERWAKYEVPNGVDLVLSTATPYSESPRHPAKRWVDAGLLDRSVATLLEKPQCDLLKEYSSHLLTCGH